MSIYKSFYNNKFNDIVINVIILLIKKNSCKFFFLITIGSSLFTI